MSARTFTLVVPTRDRPADLAACLRSIAVADNGRLREVVVVDDGSSEPARPTDPLLAAEIRVIRHDHAVGPDRCRNEAVAVATGDDVGFLDDDARVAHDWFDVASAAVDSGLRAFTGRVLPFDTGVVSRARQWRYDRRYADLPSGAVASFLAGGNSVVSREVFVRAGGFPERSAGGDNGLIARLAADGVACRFLRELRILHRNGKGFPTAARQAWRAGRCAPARPRAGTLADCGRDLASLRQAPLDVGVINATLQLVNTAGRLVGTGGS
jgi:glycosyltransferase involved in cell wall biosynthesis